MNLIICITPLQALIARQIIRQNQTKNTEVEKQCKFTCLYLPYGDNAKHRYYYVQLAELCERSVYLPLKNESWQQRFAMLSAIKSAMKQVKIWQQPINTVYLASIDVLFLQYILSKVKFQHLMTFDDGTANIFPNSSYFQPLPKSLAQRIFKSTIGIKYGSIPAILAVSSRHYTIFPNEKNIVEQIEPIYLFAGKSSNEMSLSTKPKTIKRLLLGQALDNFIGEQNYIDIIRVMKQKYHIDAFFPHPRENIDFSGLLPVIHTDKIIEDYLLTELNDHSTISYEIYTFISTAVFSLKQFPRIQIFMVYTQELWDKFPDAYQFLQDRGFNLLKLDEELLKVTML